MRMTARRFSRDYIERKVFDSRIITHYQLRVKSHKKLETKMKLTGFIVGLAAASKTSVFQINGEESVDQLDNMLATLTNGTVDDIEVKKRPYF